MSFELPNQHEGQAKCPYCREWIPEGYTEDFCPNCKKRVRCRCVICHKSFIKKDVGTRQCCYEPECLKVFRKACGSGNRFWMEQHYCAWCKNPAPKQRKYCSHECFSEVLKVRKRIKKLFDRKDWEAEFERLAELGKDYVFGGEENG